MSKLDVKSLVRLPIIDRYLLWELYKTFAMVTAILLLIIFANTFVQSLAEVVEGEFGTDVLLEMMGYQLLEMLGFVVGPSFFFAVLISLGRLYRDSEMIAMQASGIGPKKIYRIIVSGAIPVAFLVAILTLGTLPWAKHSTSKLMAEQQTESSQLAALETGRFQEFQKGEIIFFAESKGEKAGEIRNVFIQNRRNGELGLISSAEGYQKIDNKTGDLYLVLKNGQRYVGQPGRNDYSSGEFYEYGIHIHTAEQSSVDFSVKATPTIELWNSEKRLDKAELQYRLSIPLMLIALTVLGIPLSRSLPRQSIYGRLFLAFLVYFSFMNIHKMSHRWLKGGDIPDWIGMWWLPLLAIGVALLIEMRDRYSYKINFNTLKTAVLRS